MTNGLGFANVIEMGDIAVLASPAFTEFASHHKKGVAYDLCPV
jgi:hypothetical protein